MSKGLFFGQLKNRRINNASWPKIIKSFMRQSHKCWAVALFAA